MSIALANQTYLLLASGGSTTKVVTIPAPTTGNTLIVQTANLESSTQIISVSQGATPFTKQASRYGAANYLEVWTLPNCGTGTTINVVVTATYGQRADVVVSEWSGMPASIPGPDGSAPNTDSSSSPATASISPSSSPVVVVAHALAVSQIITGTPGNGFTEFTDGSGAVNRAAFAYRIFSTAATTSTSWPKSAAYGACDLLICGFDGVSGGSTPTIPRIADFFPIFPRNEYIGL